MEELTDILTRDELREKANRLPLRPGVYIMRKKNGTVIYVGKSRALKNRVSQYFGAGHGHNLKTVRMVENVCKCGTSRISAVRGFFRSGGKVSIISRKL